MSSSKRGGLIHCGTDFCEGELNNNQYADEGIEDMKILQVNPLHQFWSPVEIVSIFGGKKQYLKALSELENEIYKEIA